MKISLAILATLLSAVASNYTPDLESCQKFANAFANTCNNTEPATFFHQVPKESMSCPNPGRMTKCHNQVEGHCKWERLLCVRCEKAAETGIVHLRVQSNGLPNHCYHSPAQALEAQVVDFAVRWLPPAHENSAAQVTTQTKVNELLCDIMVSKDSNIPIHTGYIRNVGMAENTAWGVSTSGVLLFNGISADGVDPFYPAKYGHVTDPAAATERVDWCLAHPQVAGIFHYHTISPCLIDKTAWNHTGPPPDIKTYMQQAWKEVPSDTPAGISKDGRPILGPYKADGSSYSDCEVDICNGVEIDGQYMYVNTFFHPYIVGCYGKGGNPHVSQQCSTNPRKCEATVPESKVEEFIQ